MIHYSNYWQSPQHVAGEKAGVGCEFWSFFLSQLRIEPAMDPLALTNVYVKQRHDLLFFWHFPEKFNVILMAPRRKVHESFLFQMHRLGFHESMQVQAFVKYANFWNILNITGRYTQLISAILIFPTALRFIPVQMSSKSPHTRVHFQWWTRGSKRSLTTSNIFGKDNVLLRFTS